MGAVLIAVLGAAGVAFALLSKGDLPEGVLVQDDFSEVAEHWSLDSYKGITTAIEDGGYHVRLTRPDRSAHESVAFDEGNEYENVRVSVTARFESTADGAVVGLTCGYAPGDGESITGLFGRYQAEIGLDGKARILRILNADEQVLEDVQAPVALDEQETNDLHMTCRYDGRVALVTLAVNGDRAVEAEDDDPFSSFESAGMYAATRGAGLEVLFDDLQAEEIDG